jgi:hypothetical protein
MKFEIIIPKIGNKFHLISNLAEWHFSCRRYDNRVWLKESGKLTKKEKNTLKDFTKILQKYHFGEKYLGIPFIRTKENLVWDRVKNGCLQKNMKKFKKYSRSLINVLILFGEKKKQV